VPSPVVVPLPSFSVLMIKVGTSLLIKLATIERLPLMVMEMIASVEKMAPVEATVQLTKE